MLSYSAGTVFFCALLLFLLLALCRAARSAIKIFCKAVRENRLQESGDGAIKEECVDRIPTNGVP